MSVTYTLFQAAGMYAIAFGIAIIMVGALFIDKCYINGPPPSRVKWPMRLLGLLIWIWMGYFTGPMYLDLAQYPDSVEKKEITVAHIHYSRGGSQTLYEKREAYSRGYELASRDIPFTEGELAKLTYLKRSKIVLSATKIP